MIFFICLINLNCIAWGKVGEELPIAEMKNLQFRHKFTQRIDAAQDDLFMGVLGISFLFTDATMSQAHFFGFKFCEW